MESFEPLQRFLPQVWFFILGLFLFLYVLLDGFDLGVGILSLTASSETRRSILMTSLGNVWDANETWLVLMGGSLFGSFPLAYATILNALYIPLVIMVVGLILRAVSFEFRENADNKLVWNLAFGVGSFLAALGQGFALGSVFEGIRVDEAGHFAGSPWDWLTWRTLLVALTLIQGYVLIGSAYLIVKTTGELQETYYKTATIATWTTLLGAVFITISTPIMSEQARAQLFSPPLFYIFAAIPVLGLLLVALLLRSLRRREENSVLVYTFLIFALSFIGLGFMVFPNIIPPQRHHLRSGSLPQLAGVYAHLYWLSDPGYLVLQHLQLRGVPGQDRGAGSGGGRGQSSRGSLSWPEDAAITPPGDGRGNFLGAIERLQRKADTFTLNTAEHYCSTVQR